MFSDRLLAALAPWHLLRHPFYQAWMEGTLSRNQLRNYALGYYPHVLDFPRYVSAAHSLCEDAEIRRDLAVNLSDEEGVAGGVPHPELWLRFGESLGLSRDEILRTEMSEGVRALCEEYTRAARASYAEGLGSLFAYEYQVPEISRSKIAGLREFYPEVDEAGQKFFAVHQEADLYHSEACKAALDRLTHSEQSLALESSGKAARLLWGFLSEAHAHA